jgi:uncharacterized protein (UPF0548 family)
MGDVDLTYPEVGATAHATLPAGYRHVRWGVRVGAGPEVFKRLAAGMAEWRIHRDAGLVLRTDEPRPVLGGDFTSGLRFGPLRLWAPCRIVWLVDEPDRYGFGFGTVTGHPERGEESFLAEWTGEDDVYFRITAFSRPAAWYAKLGAAPARWLQDRVTRRYAAAARGLAAD